MRKSRFSEEQSLLREAEAGRKVADLRREHGFSEQTLYRWKSEYSGMDVGDVKKLRALEDENPFCLSKRFGVAKPKASDAL